MSGPSSAVPTPTRARWKSLVSLDNRYVPPAFITCILLVGHLSFGILESWPKTLLAIVVSILLELVLGRIFYRKWLHPASAYITGISVGILIRSPAFWPYALCSAISITSKYVLRVKGRHLWNPSNFGISVMLFLAGDTVASLSIQWGNYLLPMLVIWALGSIIIWRLRRFHITGIYVVSFIVFALLRSYLTGSPWQSEIAPITGPITSLARLPPAALCASSESHFSMKMKRRSLPASRSSSTPSLPAITRTASARLPSAVSRSASFPSAACMM